MPQDAQITTELVPVKPPGRNGARTATLIPDDLSSKDKVEAYRTRRRAKGKETATSADAGPPQDVIQLLSPATLSHARGLQEVADGLSAFQREGFASRQGRLSDVR